MTKQPKMMFVMDMDEYPLEGNEQISLENQKLIETSSEKANELAKHMHSNSHLRASYCYYFQLRSSAMMTAPYQDESLVEEYLEHRNKVRNLQVTYAEDLAKNQFLSGKLHAPRWAEMCDEEISKHPIKAVRDSWSSASKVLIQEPEIQPRTVKSSGAFSIMVPCMLRAFLKNFHMAIANDTFMIDNNIEEPDAFFDDALVSARNQMLLAHHLYFCDEFHPLCVPCVNPVSHEAFVESSRVAYLQVLFILLHETGHVIAETAGREALPGFETFAITKMDSPSVSMVQGDRKAFVNLDEQTIKEIEIDCFALNALLEMNVYPSELAIFSVLRLMEFFEHTYRTYAVINDIEKYRPIGGWEEVAFAGSDMGARQLSLRNHVESAWDLESSYRSKFRFFGVYGDLYKNSLGSTTTDEVNAILNTRRYSY